MPPWSQGAGSCPAREGEAGSLDGIEATVGRGKAKLFSLRVDCDYHVLINLELLHTRVSKFSHHHCRNSQVFLEITRFYAWHRIRIKEDVLSIFLDPGFFICFLTQDANDLFLIPQDDFTLLYAFTRQPNKLRLSIISEHAGDNSHLSLREEISWRLALD
jgi:hypothetical protein